MHEYTSRQFLKKFVERAGKRKVGDPIQVDAG